MKTPVKHWIRWSRTAAFATMSLTLGCGDNTQDQAETQEYCTQEAEAIPYRMLPDGNLNGGNVTWRDAPEGGYMLEDLGEGLHWVSNGFQNSMFLTTGQGVVLVDAPPTLLDAALAAVCRTTTEPVTHVIYSHAHRDHIGAADRLPADIVRIAHVETARILERIADPQRPLPTVTFDSTYELEVGDQVLRLEDIGPVHLDGNIVIHAPRQRVLALMDFLFAGHSPFPYLGHAQDIPVLRQAHDDLLAHEFEIFISGHVARYARRADLEQQRDYLDDLITTTDAVLQQITIASTMASLGPEADIMEVIAVYLDAVASEVSRQVVPRWRGTMPGVEATTIYNAVPVIQSRRVD